MTYLTNDRLDPFFPTDFLANDVERRIFRLQLNAELHTPPLVSVLKTPLHLVIGGIIATVSALFLIAKGGTFSATDIALFTLSISVGLAVVMATLKSITPLV